MEAGSLVQTRVVREAHGGLEVKIGPLHAFMPRSHCGLPRGEDLGQLVGRTFTCEVLEVDRERQRALVSRKLVLQRERESERQRELGALKPGQLVQGRVARLEPYGAFVRFGRGLQGLVHVSDLAHERVEHPADLLRVGQQIEARVLAIKERGRRIALGLKQLGESPWRRLELAHHEGQLVEGRVTRVLDFGAFVAMPPGVEGLLPLSQCGLERGQPLAALLAPGRAISVRIVELDVERERMTLSLLHEGGARILPDEAANQRSFEELVREAEPRAGLGQLGRKLADAFRARPGADPRAAG
jgi:ribosomal protein S1